MIVLALQLVLLVVQLVLLVLVRRHVLRAEAALDRVKQIRGRWL